ncbi:hypothetical protein SK128_003879 [Halocaridina rubra]|uniref:Xylose isomerase-like TIM barrel domain-containing protein n=1 Tax=Halocaridina rubra TaxID=373956 RepID=A0AAN8X147_HALRR
MSGRRTQTLDENAHLATFEANLRHAVERLSTENIVGLIEPINPVSTPGYFLNNYPTDRVHYEHFVSDRSTSRGMIAEETNGNTVSLIEKINSPYLKLQLDVFHMQMICGNLTNSMQKVMPLTGHIQVAQAPHRHEPSCPGELNYEYVFKKLREAGYSDYIGAEYSPSGKSEMSLTWIQQYSLQF